MAAGCRVLPCDVNLNPVQALAYGAHDTLAYTGTTARVELPTGTPGNEEVFRIAASTACYVAFGDSTVEASATDVYFPSGVETVKVPTGATHIAALQVSDAGTLSVTEMV